MIKDLQKLWLTNLLVNGKKDDNHIGPALNEAGEKIAAGRSKEQNICCQCKDADAEEVYSI